MLNHGHLPPPMQLVVGLLAICLGVLAVRFRAELAIWNAKALRWIYGSRVLRPRAVARQTKVNAVVGVFFVLWGVLVAALAVVHLA